MFCNKCGATLPDGSAFCSSCGQSFADSSIGQPPIQPDIPPPTQPTAPPPPYMPPPGYGAPSFVLPVPKTRHTGLIVLVSILSLFAAAAIVFLCLKLFAAPSQEPAEFSDTYSALMQSASTGTGETPEQTPAPTAIPTPFPQNAEIDLDNNFVQFSYPIASYTAQQYGSLAEFETALWSTSWGYQTSDTNPDAVMFNGGYIDIGADPTTTSEIAYTFRNDYFVSFIEFDQFDTILFENELEYWTQEIGGIFAAVGDLDTQVTYDGATYNFNSIMFINTQGNLVESFALYDPHTEIVYYISNYNVFAPVILPDGQPPISSSAHMPMEWDYDGEFKEMLWGVLWQYVATEDMPEIFDIPEFDYMEMWANTLVFDSDYTAYAELDDSSQDSFPYDIGYLHAFIVFEESEYEYDGVTYEVNYHYYIDSDGYLIESIQFYDYDLEVYLLVSNVNVYEPISP